MNKFEVGDEVYYLNDRKLYTIVSLSSVSKGLYTYNVKNQDRDLMYVREGLLSKELPAFKRDVDRDNKVYYYLTHIEDIDSQINFNLFSQRKLQRLYNWFTEPPEAKYVRDMMNPKLLRAIWQWKYWNDRRTGFYQIGLEDGMPVIIKVSVYNLAPSFTSERKAKECVEYLQREGLIDS